MTHHRYHITEGNAFEVTDEAGEKVQIGPGWLAISEAEYTQLRGVEAQVADMLRIAAKVLLARGMSGAAEELLCCISPAGAVRVKGGPQDIIEMQEVQIEELRARLAFHEAPVDGEPA